MATTNEFKSKQNYKGELQEYCAAQRLKRPEYTTMRIGGDESEPAWHCKLVAGERACGSKNIYPTKIQAENDAAWNWLKQFKFETSDEDLSRHNYNMCDQKVEVEKDKKEPEAKTSTGKSGVVRLELCVFCKANSPDHLGRDCKYNPVNIRLQDMSDQISELRLMMKRMVLEVDRIKKRLECIEENPGQGVWHR